MIKLWLSTHIVYEQAHILSIQPHNLMGSLLVWCNLLKHTCLFLSCSWWPYKLDCSNIGQRIHWNCCNKFQRLNIANHPRCCCMSGFVCYMSCSSRSYNMKNSSLHQLLCYNNNMLLFVNIKSENCNFHLFSNDLGFRISSISLSVNST